MPVRLTQQSVDVLIKGSGATTTYLDLTITTDLSLTQSIGSNLIDESLTSTLNLTQSYRAGEPELISDTINFSESVEEFGEQLTITDTIVLTDSLDAGFDFQDLTTELSLTQSIIADTGGDLTISIGTELNLTQTAIGGYDQGLTTSLYLTQALIEITPISDSLGLVQTIAPSLISKIKDSLSLSQSLNVATIYTLSASDTITLHQTVLGDGKVDTCKYNPQVGSIVTAYTPPTLTPPSFTDTTLLLQFPKTSPTSSLTLRNPQFGNLDTLAYQRINRDTRGGTALIFADPDWPKQESFQLTINSLKESQRDDLEDFLATSLGQEILLTDWEGNEHVGVITNNPETTQTGKSQYSVSITFEKTVP